MKLNILVVTKYKWHSRLKKHNEIKKLMMQGKFSDIRFTTLHTDVGAPEVVDGRITERWFEEHVTKLGKREDYNFVVFQFSEKDGKKWGLDDSIRGSNFIDNDFYGESWVRADEDSIVKFKDGVKLNKYTKVVPHEIAHELKRQDITQLEVHDYDYKNEKHNLDLFYKELGNSKTILDSLKAKLLDLQSQLSKKPVHFFDKQYKITQPFGEKNKIYTKTETHIGTDYATPLKTPIYAPLEGTLTSTQGKETGLTITLETNRGWYQFLHCEFAYPNGTYRKGQLIGYTGNSGTKTTGAHCCVRFWKVTPDVSKLNNTNVSDYLLDVTKIT